MNLHDGAIEAQDEVLFEVINGFGVITLNRPRALNAITHGMVRSMWTQLTAWADDPAVRAVLIEGAGEKAFCAGGDVRALYDSRLSNATHHRDFFVDEYRLDYLIHRYPKPYLALLDGIVMGGGMGVAQGAALRIVTDKTRLAMPETGIGLFPDVGASWFLGHLAPTLARYLGLVGATIGAADALYCGLADVWLEGDAPLRLRETLWQLDWSQGDTADPLGQLRAAILPLGRTWTDAARLMPVRATLDRHFSAIDVSAIVASLQADADRANGASGANDADNTDSADNACTSWTVETLALLKQRSPLSLCVTDRQLQKGRRLDLADAFRMELVLGYHAFESGDFVEGVRALLIDKDKNPRWRYALIADVPVAQVDAFFTSPWAADAHPLRTLGEDA